MKSKKPRKRKLVGNTRKLASKYIAEEVATGQYPRSQAVAIGISRAKREIGLKSQASKLTRLLKKYR
jgi:hypothetical protein